MNARDRKMIEFFQVLAVLAESEEALDPGELGTRSGLTEAEALRALEGLRQAGFPLDGREGKWRMATAQRGLDLKEVLALMLASLVELPPEHPGFRTLARATEKLGGKKSHLRAVEPAPAPDTEPVAIEFTAEAAPRVLQSNPSHLTGARRTAEKPDGSVVLSLETSLTPEFVRWVVSFGSQARVLFPAVLQEQIDQQAAQAPALYARAA